jgi:microcystin-dependent protein
MKTQISQLQTLQLTLQSGQTEIESSLSTLFPLGSFIAINGTVTKDQMNALGRALCDGSSIGSQVKDAVLQGTTLNLAGRTLVGEGKYAKDETITFQLGHVDEYTIGDATYKGEPMHLLTFAEMPYHTHGISTKIAQGGNGTEFPFPNEKYSSTAAEIATQPAGGDQPHNNMSPFHVVQWYIKVK